jgi:ParB family chromosome partitioning protein
MSTKVIPDQAYQTVNLSLLDESPTNPRRTFEPNKLAELADSIRIHGLIQPITVRPQGKRFEIVAGARRFRAAQLADQTAVPVRILNLTDEQTVEVQIIENSQRQDVHPYEEAAGYQRLLELPGYDVAALSSKTGKSQSHIYARLSLMQLIPEVAEAFQQERITASHANLIARLTPEQQAEAFQQCFRTDWRDKEPILLPAKNLAAWITSNLYLPLERAPFPADDANLVPEAGACVDCPRRSGANTQLFADLANDQCFDRECYQHKITVYLDRELANAPELVQIKTSFHGNEGAYAEALDPHDYTVVRSALRPAEDDSAESDEDEEDDVDGPVPDTDAVCSSTKPALVVFGPQIGTRVSVCTDKECPIHHPQRNYERDPEQEQRWKEHQRRIKAEERERKAREARYTALIERLPKIITEEQQRFLLNGLVLGDTDLSRERLAMRFEGDESTNFTAEEVCANVLAKLEPERFAAFLAELALGSYVSLPPEGEVDVLARAEELFPDTKPKGKATKNPPKVTPKAAGKGSKKTAAPSTAKAKKATSKRGKA